MMTNEELAAAIKAGDTELMEQLWNQCYCYIRQQALRWYYAWESRSGFDIDDLTQAGYIALCAAIDGYKKDMGGFLHYLSFYLKTEFSKVVGCRTASQNKEPLNNAVSLDAPAYPGDDCNTMLGEIVPCDYNGIEAVEDALYQSHVRKVVREAVDSLPEKQSIAVKAHYLENKTYSEIASMLQVANSYPGQLVKDGIKGLRNGSHAPTLAQLMWGHKNFYAFTSYNAWKRTGCGAPELAVIMKEREIERYKLDETRESKIRYCVKVLGMDREQAERIMQA